MSWPRCDAAGRMNPPRTSNKVSGGHGKPGDVRSASRFWYTTSFRNNNLGFRVARTIEEWTSAHGRIETAAVARDR